jgi:hypothetical protein
LESWGEYESGNLVLVQLAMKVLLKPGEAVIFYSCEIIHIIEELKSYRSVVTLFSHAYRTTYINRNGMTTKNNC